MAHHEGASTHQNNEIDDSSWIAAALAVPKELTFEEIAIQKLNKIINDFPGAIEQMLQKGRDDGTELEVITTDANGESKKQKWTSRLEELTTRKVLSPAPGQDTVKLESLEDYTQRRERTLRQLSKDLYEQHIKPEREIREAQLRTIVEEVNAEFEKTISSLPDKSAEEKAVLFQDSRFDLESIMRQARQRWDGVLIDAKSEEREEGTLHTTLRTVIDDTLIEISKKRFEAILSKENGAIDVDAWVRSATTIQDSELEKIVSSGILDNKNCDDLRKAQRAIAWYGLSSPIVACGSLVFGWFVSPGWGSAVAGLASVACVTTSILAFLRHRDFDSCFETVWDTTLKQLEAPVNMEAARAWAGLFFKVIRDYNPIHPSLRPHNTNLWLTSPNSLDSAILESLKTGALYASGVVHNPSIQDGPADPVTAVAVAKKFTGHINRVSSEINAFGVRWTASVKSLNIVQGTSTGIAVFNLLGHLADVLNIK